MRLILKAISFIVILIIASTSPVLSGDIDTSRDSTRAELIRLLKEANDLARARYPDSALTLCKPLVERTRNEFGENDNTIAHNKKLYQIKEKVISRKVVVEERLNGSLHISGGGVSLKYREITERPPKAISPERRRRSGKSHLPARDHPWRRPLNSKSIARKELCTQLTK